MELLKYTCEKSCCSICTTRGIFKTFHKKNKKKSGIFIYDPEEKRVLLVQSCGLFWGPPKGTLEEGINETILECAIREVKEETGLDISPEELRGEIKVKNKITFFYCERKTCSVQIQNIKGNDANGITWIKIECLKDLIKTKKIIVNRHCILTMLKFLNVKLCV
jgi:ADP-ribose pyrophosphatase YjhB (NUDIX family)